MREAHRPMLALTLGKWLKIIPVRAEVVIPAPNCHWICASTLIANSEQTCDSRAAHQSYIPGGYETMCEWVAEWEEGCEVCSLDPMKLPNPTIDPTTTFCNVTTCDMDVWHTDADGSGVACGFLIEQDGCGAVAIEYPTTWRSLFAPTRRLLRRCYVH